MARDSEKDFLDLITAHEGFVFPLFCLRTLLFMHVLFGIALPIRRPQ